MKVYLEKGHSMRASLRIEGSLPELQELVKMMADVMDMVKE